MHHTPEDPGKRLGLLAARSLAEEGTQSWEPDLRALVLGWCWGREEKREAAEGVTGPCSRDRATLWHSRVRGYWEDTEL